MCTSFAKDLARWTCDDERAARDAVLEGWAQALHEAAQHPPTPPAPEHDAAAPDAGAAAAGVSALPGASVVVAPPAVAGTCP